VASTISEVANKLSNVLDKWSTFVNEIGEWATGSTSGGPNGDGKYPITKPSGSTVMLTGLKLMLDQVEGPAAQAENAAQTSELARDEAQKAESLTKRHRNDAQNATNSAINALQKRFPSDSKFRVPVPLTVTPNTVGNQGTFAWDDSYVYLKTTQGWKKIPLQLL